MGTSQCQERAREREACPEGVAVGWRVGGSDLSEVGVDVFEALIVGGWRSLPVATEASSE